MVLRAHLGVERARRVHLAAWDEARAEREALVRWIEHTATGDGARVALTSAEFALRCGPYVAWTALLERSLPSTSGEPRADALILLARLHLRLGNLDRADQLAAQVARKGACNMHVARAAGVLAEVYDRRGEVARALDTITTVQRPTLKALGRERELAEAVGQQAEVMARSGAMTEAVVLRRREQLPLLRRLGDDRLVAESLGKIVEVYQAQERWGEASRLLREEVMPTLERIGDPRARIAGMMQAVEDLFASGDPATAMEVLEAHVIPEAAFLGDANMHVRALARLADAQYMLLWEHEAERFRDEEVYPRVEHLRDPHLLFWVLRHVADTYLLMGRHEMASCLLTERLLPAAEATGSRRSIATAHALRASVLLCEGRRADAIDVLRAQVVPAFEAPGCEHDWLFAQMRVLRLLTAEGRLDEALGAARGLLPTANRVGALDYCAPAIHDTAGALSLGRPPRRRRLAPRGAPRRATLPRRPRGARARVDGRRRRAAPPTARGRLLAEAAAASARRGCAPPTPRTPSRWRSSRSSPAPACGWRSRTRPCGSPERARGGVGLFHLGEADRRPAPPRPPAAPRRAGRVAPAPTRRRCSGGTYEARNRASNSIKSRNLRRRSSTSTPSDTPPARRSLRTDFAAPRSRAKYRRTGTWTVGVVTSPPRNPMTVSAAAPGSRRTRKLQGPSMKRFSISTTNPSKRSALEIHAPSSARTKSSQRSAGKCCCPIVRNIWPVAARPCLRRANVSSVTSACMAKRTAALQGFYLQPLGYAVSRVFVDLLNHISTTPLQSRFFTTAR